MNTVIEPVRHGLIMAIIALVSGALWAAFMATQHERIHSEFEAQQERLTQVRDNHLIKDMSMENLQLNKAHDEVLSQIHGHDHATESPESNDMHSHSGSFAKDAMQRLLRGHIHFMGLGVLTAVLLLVTAFTSLKDCWKKVLGWTFGLGAVAYPPAWILMGFRTVEMGPAGAEASVLWLFGPAVGLLLTSMVALLFVMLLEATRLNQKKLFSWAFGK